VAAAGAIAGKSQALFTEQENAAAMRRFFCRPGMAGMPKMQEHSSAARQGRRACSNCRIFSLRQILSTALVAVTDALRQSHST
jgi:hypothetical protein